ncbi:MAG: M56 family metallopeptidase, partial [Chitinophagaceae bacterium]|nr:M56 family metallopeptidase [Chitinophagaceae bacterium]
HELGHVKRNDYLVALIQSLIKTLFFFNPFLLWISNQIDKEREHACDDIAVNINKNPLLFANTLKEFADMNMNLKTAMSINGNKLLLTRVTRLFNQPQKATSVKSRLLATLLIIASGGVVLCVNADNANNEEKTVTLKMEKPLPTAEAFALAITQINQQCDTNVTLEPLKHNDGVKRFSMSAMKCSHAIRKLTGAVAAENIEVPKNGNKVNFEMKNRSVADVMAEVNKQCGTDAKVPDAIRNEKSDFGFTDTPCEKVIIVLQNYTN